MPFTAVIEHPTPHQDTTNQDRLSEEITSVNPLSFMANLCCVENPLVGVVAKEKGDVLQFLSGVIHRLFLF